MFPVRTYESFISYQWYSNNELKFTYNFGKKAKGRISKRVFQENKAWQIFRKLIRS